MDRFQKDVLDLWSRIWQNCESVASRRLEASQPHTYVSLDATNALSAAVLLMSGCKVWFLRALDWMGNQTEQSKEKIIEFDKCDIHTGSWVREVIQSVLTFLALLRAFIILKTSWNSETRYNLFPRRCVALVYSGPREDGKTVWLRLDMTRAMEMLY